MKKLFLTTTLILTLISCSNNNETLPIEDELLTTDVSFNKQKEDEPLIRKLANTFNNIIKDEELFNNLKQISNESNFNEGYYLFDPITIKDHEVKSSAFNKYFTKAFSELYGTEFIYEEGFLSLPKFHFGIPKIAFEEFDIWKENGYPIIAKSYDLKDNKLLIINEKEAINILGNENYKKLNSLHKGEQLYSTKKNEYTTIITASENKGAIVKLNNLNNEITFATFTINDEQYHNSIDVITNEKKYTLKQEGLLEQTYVDIFNPFGCNSFYVFECGTIKYENFLRENQQRADETCETFRTCVPLCCNGSVIWAMMEFRPQPIRCAIAMDYLSELSMYSLMN